MTQLQTEWRAIRRYVSHMAPFHTFALIDADGRPRALPIGSLQLGEVGQGMFFELFAKTPRECAADRSQICILVTNTGLRFWFGALLRGRFSQHPALRLFGRLGDLREVTPAEQRRFRRRIRALRLLPGYRMLWGKPCLAREIHFDRVEPVRLGQMSAGLTGLEGRSLHE